MDEKKNMKGKMIQLFCIFGIIVIIISGLLHKEQVKIILQQFIEWIKENPNLAIFIIIMFYTVVIPLYFPIAYANLTLGYTYSQVFKSQWKGFFFIVPIISIGVFSGSMLTFLLSRYLFRECVTSQVKKYEWFRALDQILIKKGKVSVALLRLTFMHFGFCCYVLGVSQISLIDYFIGTFSWAIHIFIHCYIGSILYLIEREKDKQSQT